MKKRRTAIIAFLLCACLCIGAGYAALTDNLFIKGEATLATTEAQKDFDEDVYFTQENTKVKATTGTSGIQDTVTVGATDNDSVTFYVKSLATSNETLQESVTFQIEIYNAGNAGYDAIVSLDTGYPTTTNSAFFDITYAMPNGNRVEIGEKLLVEVTVTLLKNPTENLTAAFNVNLTATSADPLPSA